MLFVMPMKFSMNTSRNLVNDYVAIIWCLVEYFAVSSMRFSKECSGRLTSYRRASITSCAVSEVAQNKGGYLYHPICRQFGTTMLISSILFFRIKVWHHIPKVPLILVVYL